MNQYCCRMPMRKVSEVTKITCHIGKRTVLCKWTCDSCQKRRQKTYSHSRYVELKDRGLLS